jgi:hypothetical protein
MMMHESWTGAFIQGVIMGLGMMVVMMVPGVCRVIACRIRHASLRGAPNGRDKAIGWPTRPSKVARPGVAVIQ